jgi:hypothetical protein
MKITSFGFTLRRAVREDGYGDNYYVTIDENGVTNVSHPYVTINHKEQAAILGIIQSAIVKYGILVNECDKVNRALKLEEYAPKVSAEETASEIEPESAASQSCALGGGEVSTGADGDIDKPKSAIITDEDIFGE